MQQIVSSRELVRDTFLAPRTAEMECEEVGGRDKPSANEICLPRALFFYAKFGLLLHRMQLILGLCLNPS